MATKSFYIKESQLDIQQRNIVDKELSQHLVVTGGAGSGKSVLALWKAKAIQDNEDSVLYVVKTVALTQFMKDGVDSVGLKSNVIISFNRCFQWVKDDNGQWQNLGWKVGNYDYIILDEATDLDVQEIQELRSHCRYFIAFGDNAQQLYAFKGTATTVESIVKVLGAEAPKIDYLLYNHRLPKKMARLVVYFHPNIAFGSREAKMFVNRCTSEGMELPHIFKYLDENSELDDIIKIVKNKNGGLKDVGILFRDKNTMERAYHYFVQHNMSCSMTIDSKFIGNPFSSDAPKLMTFHSSKGLQFETVFVPNCSDTFNGDASFYVALTRTYAHLYIMHIGTIPTMFNIVPKDLYDANSLTSDREFVFSHSARQKQEPSTIEDEDDLPF